MKVIVTDAEIFPNIELEQLTNYLQFKGWYFARPFFKLRPVKTKLANRQ